MGGFPPPLFLTCTTRPSHASCLPLPANFPFLVLIGSPILLLDVASKRPCCRVSVLSSGCDPILVANASPCRNACRVMVLCCRRYFVEGDATSLSSRSPEDSEWSSKRLPTPTVSKITGSNPRINRQLNAIAEPQPCESGSAVKYSSPFWLFFPSRIRFVPKTSSLWRGWQVLFLRVELLHARSWALRCLVLYQAPPSKVPLVEQTSLDLF